GICHAHLEIVPSATICTRPVFCLDADQHRLFSWGFIMSIQNLLQQILQSGKGVAQDTSSALSNSPLGQGTMRGFGGGALMGGALGLLLGNKKFRKMGGSLAGYGGAAALGALTLKTYQDWQSRQANSKPGAKASSAPAAAAPLRLTDVSTPMMEQHS